jgi:hypothetical protein
MGTEVSQVKINHIAYCEKYQEDLEREHMGRIALMHDGEVVAIYNDSGDAYAIGVEKFGLGEFSTKLIGREPMKLGILTVPLT